MQTRSKGAICFIRAKISGMPSESDAQSLLFGTNDSVTLTDVVEFALGDFQARGFELVDRRIALDRLLGAVKRACDIYDVDLISDEQLAEELARLGAKVEKLPSFVAKHPFRLTIPKELAESTLEKYRSIVADG